jgi:deazaflavin-dependent oxidoreductase (nitroreductase family)
MKEERNQPPESITGLISSLKQQDYCYLTTTGRVSGRPHEIEIWFGAHGSTLYLLSGSHKSDWVRNLRKDPAVTVRIADHTFTGIARVVSDKEEELRARYLVAEKYQEWEEGKMLSQWAQTALPIAIDVNL